MEKTIIDLIKGLNIQNIDSSLLDLFAILKKHLKEEEITEITHQKKSTTKESS